MKNYQYVLFDWDGCLAKTLHMHLNAYKETFAEFEMFPTDFEIAQHVFGDWNGPAKLGVSDVNRFTELYLNRVAEQFVQAPLYPHALEVIQHFSQSKKKLAIVTTTTQKFIYSALKETKLAQYFDVVLAAEDVKEHKPSAEVIEKALELLHGTKDQAIIIGDSKSDLGAANNAGIDSVLFFPEDHKVFYDKSNLIETFSPTFVISDHKELQGIIQ